MARGILIAVVVALWLLALAACVTVNTPATAEHPDGGTALTFGMSSDNAAALQDSGLLDFLPAPLRGVAKAGLMYAGVRLGQSAVTKSGRANWAVLADPDASRGAKGAAAMHNVLGTSSPLEAVDRRIASEVTPNRPPA
jgi:hypothetical protein